jgi:hypothetical protein
MRNLRAIVSMMVTALLLIACSKDNSAQNAANNQAGANQACAMATHNLNSQWTGGTCATPEVQALVNPTATGTAGAVSPGLSPAANFMTVPATSATTTTGLVPASTLLASTSTTSTTTAPVTAPALVSLDRSVKSTIGDSIDAGGTIVNNPYASEQSSRTVASTSSSSAAPVSAAASSSANASESSGLVAH